MSFGDVQIMETIMVSLFRNTRGVDSTNQNNAQYESETFVQQQQQQHCTMMYMNGISLCVNLKQ